MEPTERILQTLLSKSSWTKEDRDWLLEYLQKADNPELRLLLLEQFSTELADGNENPLPVAEKLLRQIHNRIHPPEKKKPALLTRFKKLSAAAAILLLVSTGGYFLLNRPGKLPPVTTVKNIQQKDIPAPASSNAVITLANGQQLVLDSAGSGILATQGNVTVVKTADGQLVYNGMAEELMYNTLSNPRGSRAISLTLADGSKVWLNSESSLRYPTSFSGKDRRVEITGEAYFEVTKKAGQPFMVTIAGKEKVEVLGTHFNINSYEDEQAIKVTLLEGSIKVSAVHTSSPVAVRQTVIEPGQQALYQPGSASGAIEIKNNVNIAAVMAWKNGFFNFDQADLQTVLRQLSRWYNVTVVFSGNIPKRTFGGEMQRDLNLSEVLKLLEKNNIHFRIAENKLIVSP